MPPVEQQQGFAGLGVFQRDPARVAGLGVRGHARDAACAQVDVIQPKVIVALGTFAARALLRTLDPISRLRGRVFEYRGAKLIPTFHPAYLLRNPSSKREVWEDMLKVLEQLGQPITEKQRGYFLKG